MSVADTSLSAYLNEILPALTAKQAAVLDVFERNADRDFTNEEVAAELGWKINRVTGRTNELRNDLKLVMLSRRRECLVTHRMVKAWKLRGRAVAQPQMPEPAPLHYQVPSGSERMRSHVIKQEGPRLSCTCKGFHFRGVCRHVKKIARQEWDPSKEMDRLL